MLLWVIYGNGGPGNPRGLYGCFLNARERPRKAAYLGCRWRPSQSFIQLILKDALNVSFSHLKSFAHIPIHEKELTEN